MTELTPESGRLEIKGGRALRKPWEGKPWESFADAAERGFAGQGFVVHAGAMSLYRRRWMLFVDGENLAIRAQQFAAVNKAKLREGPHYYPDVFIWPPDRPSRQVFSSLAELLQPDAIRAYYFTSAVGDEPGLLKIREGLWAMGFQPEVFKKDGKSVKSKGVDIALTTTMLSHAALGNYEAAVLIAGDGDYLPLVTEVKRLGRFVCVAFFQEPGLGLNPALRLAADDFMDLTPTFMATLLF